MMQRKKLDQGLRELKKKMIDSEYDFVVSVGFKITEEGEHAKIDSSIMSSEDDMRVTEIAYSALKQFIERVQQAKPVTENIENADRPAEA